MTYFGLKGYVVHGEEFPLQGRPTFKKDLVTSKKSLYLSVFSVRQKAMSKRDVQVSKSPLP